jgi:hypothetical protein
MGSLALQSKDYRDLLNIIDKLRSKGISRVEREENEEYVVVYGVLGSRG